MPTQENAAALAESFKTGKSDTGNTSVQVALLTARINHLSKHIESNKKDYSSRLGLLKLVGQRRRLLNYLGKSDAPQYAKVIAELGLRK